MSWATGSAASLIGRSRVQLLEPERDPHLQPPAVPHEATPCAQSHESAVERVQRHCVHAAERSASRARCECDASEQSHWRRHERDDSDVGPKSPDATDLERLDWDAPSERTRAVVEQAVARVWDGSRLPHGTCWTLCEWQLVRLWACSLSLLTTCCACDWQTYDVVNLSVPAFSSRAVPQRKTSFHLLELIKRTLLRLETLPLAQAQSLNSHALVCVSFCRVRSVLDVRIRDCTPSVESV